MMFKEIKNIYISTLSNKDHLWTRVIGRPFAAVVVYFIKDLPVTPNQITAISYLTAFLSGLVFVFCRGYAGLIAGVLIYQLAYIFDCVDGQLARVKNMSSKIGHLFDLLVDAAKALTLLACISLRLFLIYRDSRYLIFGVIGVALVAVAIMFTDFSRKQEYQKKDAGSGEKLTRTKTTGIVPLLLKMTDKPGRLLIYYPGYIVYFCLFNRLEWFFFLYVGTYILYTAKIFLAVFMKMSRT